MKNEFENCKPLKNRQGFANPFIHYFLSFFKKVLLLPTLLMLVIKMPCLADDFADVDAQYSWLRTGLFCFRTGTVAGTNDQIHLVQYANGKFEELFTKAIGCRVKPPICLTNGVIVVSGDGMVRRLDLKGEYVFAAKPKGFDGLAREIGRLDDHHIFIVGGVFSEKTNGFQYRLYNVNVSGAEPVLKMKFDIIKPYQITRALDEIIVVGETNTLRLKIPEGP